MTTIAMRVFKLRSESRAFIAPTSAGPVIAGGGDVDYTCAKCKSLLLKQVRWAAVKEIAVECLKCKTLNAVPDPAVPAKKKVFGKAPLPVEVDATPLPPRAPALTPDGRRKVISVVTPCYNEEENVREVHTKVRAIFEAHLPHYDRQHIFADNASTDSTPQILRELAAEDPSVCVIYNARNFGPLKSTYNGVMSATGDGVLIFLPADLQDPPELLPTFVQLWEQGNEIVYGIRATREESWIMRNVRNTYYRLLTSFSEVKVPPGVGDFQFVDQSVIKAMRRVYDAYPFLRMMTFECGGKRIGISYKWLARKRGFSKNRMSALIDQGLNGLVSFTTAPMRLGLYLGFLTSFAAVLYAIATVVIELVGAGRPAPPGIPTLIVALFFFGGVQLFFMGLLGEYILAIYSQVRSKPVVFERERLNFTVDSTMDAPPRIAPPSGQPVTLENAPVAQTTSAK